MFVVLHGNTVFCGYSNGVSLWNKFTDMSIKKVIQPYVYANEVDAVAEANSIRQFDKTVKNVLVVPIEQWISENKK